jgi:hypothetical protein
MVGLEEMEAKKKKANEMRMMSSTEVMTAVKRVAELEAVGDKGRRLGDIGLSRHVYQQGIEAQT